MFKTAYFTAIIFLNLFTLLPQNILAAEFAKPHLQLASVYVEPKDIEQYWISEKLDGVRGYWNGRTLYTRQGNIINVPHYFIKNWPNLAMDGELWIARGQFEAISGLVRTANTQPEQWRLVKFHLFDLPEHLGNFSERIKAMKQITRTANNAHLTMINQYQITSLDILNNKLDEITSQGGEGLMLHHKDAAYQIGRTDSIMKLKTYFDAEATIIEYIEGKGKYQGMMGSILVETVEGVRFKIGSGFTDEQRKNPPEIGCVITFKYYGTTKFNIPKFASFIRVRTDK